MPTLLELENAYFQTDASGGRVFTANTEVLPLIDGVNYFTELNTALMSTSNGDAIYILGWTFDAKMDLLGRTETDANYQPIGKLLAEKASVGVDVRIILNGNMYLFDRSYPPNPFYDSFLAAQLLRNWKVQGPKPFPLIDRVMFDWSGPKSGSHHQKSILVKTSIDIVGFVGGMDIWVNRRDSNSHNTLKWDKDNSRWGWHDIAVKLRGAALEAIWDNFRQRYSEAFTLPPHIFWIPSDISSQLPDVSKDAFNPPMLFPPSPFQPNPTYPVSAQSVQVLRSRSPEKIPNLILNGFIPWDGPPTGAIHEVYATYKKAINSATRYIYIEDQFLSNSPVIQSAAKSFSIFPDLQSAAAKGVKIILVGSGKSDPADFPSAGTKNLTLTEDIRKIVYPPGVPIPYNNNIVVWRLENCTVHAKIMIIDDVFASIGSANMQSRSMYGSDIELQVGIVDTADVVRNFRISLWAEHLRIGQPPFPIDVQNSLVNLDTALGIWRQEWLPIIVSSGMWRTTDDPLGFHPLEIALSFVGPQFSLEIIPPIL